MAEDKDRPIKELRQKVKDLERAVAALEKAVIALSSSDKDQIASISRVERMVSALDARVLALEAGGGQAPVEPPEPPEPPEPQLQILSLADQRAIQRLKDHEDPKYALRFEGKRGFFSDWRKNKGDGPCPGKDDSKSCHEGPFGSIAEAVEFFFEKTGR